MPPTPPRYVVTDANVLINFMHVRRLALLGALPAFTFVVPDPVVAEITDPGHVQQLQEALQRQDLHQEAITALPELTAYAARYSKICRPLSPCLQDARPQA